MKTKNVMRHSPKFNSEEPNFELRFFKKTDTTSGLINSDNNVIRIDVSHSCKECYCEFKISCKGIMQWVSCLIEDIYNRFIMKKQK